MMDDKKGLTMGSLFDGIGGWCISAIRNGVRPVWASEIEPFCIEVTKRRFPQVEQLGDITKIDGKKLEPVDIICAGSPCQGLSLAGKQLGLLDDRSCLFYDFIRIVREMKEATGGKYPKWCVWENVPGAFSSNAGNDIIAVLECFDEIGYVGDMTCLDAQYMGVPQRRKRIFAVWENVETIKGMEDKTSFAIVSQMLAELVVSRLCAGMKDHITEKDSPLLLQGKFTEEGYDRKLKLFDIATPQKFRKLVDRWFGILPKYLDRDSKKFVEKMDRSLYSFFKDKGHDDYYCCDCAILSEKLLQCFLHMPELQDEMFESIEYLKMVRKVCVDYVRKRETGISLFESVDWVQHWDVYIDSLSEA